MTTVTVGHHPELTVEDVKSIFQRHFGDKYEIVSPRTPPTGSLSRAMAGDFLIKKNAWVGVSVLLVQEPDKTILFLDTRTPALWAGATLVLLPLTIWVLLSWRTMTKEVRAFIEQAEEFR